MTSSSPWFVAVTGDVFTGRARYATGTRTGDASGDGGCRTDDPGKEGPVLGDVPEGLLLPLVQPRLLLSHCCFYHHVHTLSLSPIAIINLDAAGRPVFPTHTDGPNGYRIRRSIADWMATKDFTSPILRDAFCLHCGKAFCSDVCAPSHHNSEGLPDAVIRIVRHGGRHCVRCTGTEWWTEFMDGVLGDPVHVGEDEQGRYYELLPVLRCGPGEYCNNVCMRHHRDVDGRRRRREARHAALTAEDRQQLNHVRFHYYSSYICIPLIKSGRKIIIF